MFKDITYSDFRFMRKHMTHFDDPTTLGASSDGIKFTNMLITQPMGTSIERDMQKGRTEVPSCRMVYTNRSDMVNGYKEFVTGSAGIDNPTSTKDELIVTALCTRSFEGFGGNRWAIDELA
jgi:hypothetical protein